MNTLLKVCRLLSNKTANNVVFGVLIVSLIGTMMKVPLASTVNSLAVLAYILVVIAEGIVEWDALETTRKGWPVQMLDKWSHTLQAFHRTSSGYCRLHAMIACLSFGVIIAVMAVVFPQANMFAKTHAGLFTVVVIIVSLVLSIRYAHRHRRSLSKSQLAERFAIEVPEADQEELVEFFNQNQLVLNEYALAGAVMDVRRRNESRGLVEA